MEPIGDVFRRESGRIVASLIRFCGDFDLAEDAMQDAFLVASDAWARDGVPDNPGAWLVTTAKRRLIDRLRRDTRRDDKEALVARVQKMPVDPADREDDLLRLVFTCCHPALALDARVALTLRTVCGLTTAGIAAAFLVPEATMGQRLSRAKHKIRVTALPYRIPEPDELAGRIGAVLSVVYLVFNAGYNAASAAPAEARALCAEAIGLARLLDVLIPNKPEVMGLLALMLLHDARRAARTDSTGRVVLLDDQDRAAWDRAKVAEGLRLVERAPRLGPVGQYWLQAAIAAEHVAPSTAGARDWQRICSLYDRLVDQTGGSPVVRLNRAVAVSMVDGPDVALAQLDPLRERLDGYVFFHSVEADLLVKTGRPGRAAAAYRRAIALAAGDAQRAALSEALENLDPDH